MIIMTCRREVSHWQSVVAQIVYAARDALLTAYAYRQLRAWHEAAVDPTPDTRVCEVRAETVNTAVHPRKYHVAFRDSALCLSLSRSSRLCYLEDSNINVAPTTAALTSREADALCSAAVMWPSVWRGD
jgi:hypothetical protein